MRSAIRIIKTLVLTSFKKLVLYSRALCCCSLGEQKDINEFAGMLFDKLENNKECGSLLASTIQGTIVWKTRSTETPVSRGVSQ